MPAKASFLGLGMPGTEEERLYIRLLLRERRSLTLLEGGDPGSGIMTWRGKAGTNGERLETNGNTKSNRATRRRLHQNKLLS